MARKQILFLIESLSGGGAEKVLVTLLQNLDSSKFDVTLCVVVDSGIHKNNLPSHIKYIPIIKEPTSFFKKILYKIKYKMVYEVLPLKLVYKLFVPHECDVEVAFVEGYCTKLLSYSTNEKSKKVAWVHTDLVNNHWIKSVYQNQLEELWSYHKYDIIIGVSSTVVNSVKKLYGIENVKILYNPIDSVSILKLANRQEKTNSERLRLVSTGRLVEQKGYDRLLRIFKRLIDDDYDIELLILGEGVERNKLQDYIKQNKLQNMVSMPGFVENPYAEMANCDLFICSSRSEGYSTAVTEALILGLPVVTTNCSGMDELLGNGEYGVIAENDEQKLCESLKNIIGNSDKMAYFKQKAIERGKSFSITNLMKPIEQILS